MCNKNITIIPFKRVGLAPLTLMLQIYIADLFTLFRVFFFSIKFNFMILILILYNVNSVLLLLLVYSDTFLIKQFKYKTK